MRQEQIRSLNVHTDMNSNNSEEGLPNVLFPQVENCPRVNGK